MGYSHATASSDQPSGRGSTRRPKRPPQPAPGGARRADRRPSRDVRRPQAPRRLQTQRPVHAGNVGETCRLRRKVIALKSYPTRTRCDRPSSAPLVRKPTVRANGLDGRACAGVRPGNQGQQGATRTPALGCRIGSVTRPRSRAQSGRPDEECSREATSQCTISVFDRYTGSVSATAAWANRWSSSRSCSR